MKNLISTLSYYVPHSLIIGLIIVFVIGIITAFHGCGLPKNHLCGIGCYSTAPQYMINKPYSGE